MIEEVKKRKEEALECLYNLEKSITELVKSKGGELNLTFENGFDSHLTIIEDSESKLVSVKKVKKSEKFVLFEAVEITGENDEPEDYILWFEYLLPITDILLKSNEFKTI